MSENKSMSKDYIQRYADGIVDKFREDVLRSKDYGNLSFWMSLLKDIMALIQSTVKLKGLDKMEIAMDSIHKLANAVLETNPGELDMNTHKTINIVLSDEGLGIMKATTGIIKNFMRSIDTNGDGEISSQECRDLFSCCFPKVDKSKK